MKMMFKLPSQKELKHRFRYDQKTGFLFWRNHPRYPSLNGKRAGSLQKNGYRQVAMMGGRRVAEHRIIWKMQHGSSPIRLDHRDRKKSNNKLKNLRRVSLSQSGRNRKGWSSTGVKGVSFDKVNEKFFTHVTVNKKQYTAGRFTSLRQATIAVRKLRKRLHGKFVHHD